MAKQTRATATEVFNATVDTVVNAYRAEVSAQVSIGAAIVSAAEVIKKPQIEKFVGEVKKRMAEFRTAGTIKVEASRIRRVLTCLIEGTIKVEPDATLREMYDLCPKDAAKGGRKTGAKLPNGGAKSDGGYETITPVKTEADKADAFKAAVTVLFGTCNPELIAAMQYAVSHSGVFMSWATASAKAEQLAELEKAVTPATKKPATKRARKTAATA